MSQKPWTSDRESPNALSPYEKIKDAIRYGVFAPGAALVESTLAQWCGVSRTPIREALSRLEQDGLASKTDRGMVVRERTPEEILDIYETRIALEGLAARLAAQRHTQMDAMRLNRTAALCEQAGDDLDLRVDRNREYHRSIWLAGHNESLTDLLERLNLHLLRYPMTTLSFPGRWEESLTEHTALSAAIVAGDAERAEELARAHFGVARDIRLRIWEEQIV